MSHLRQVTAHRKFSVCENPALKAEQIYSASLSQTSQKRMTLIETIHITIISIVFPIQER